MIRFTLWLMALVVAAMLSLGLYVPVALIAIYYWCKWSWPASGIFWHFANGYLMAYSSAAGTRWDLFLGMSSIGCGIVALIGIVLGVLLLALACVFLIFLTFEKWDNLIPD